ncbi:MAG: PsbP-related protein [Nitrososphaeraceae archaeon]
MKVLRLDIDKEELNTKKLTGVLRLLYIKNNKIILSLLTIAAMVVLLMSSSSTLKQSALAQKNATTTIKPSPPPISTKPTGNFLTYENPAIGIKVQYPSDWLKNATSQGVIFVLPNRNNTSNPEQFLAKLDAYNVPSFPSNIPLKTMADGVINGYKRTLPNFQLESYTNTTLAGNPAIKIIYTFMNSKGDNVKAADIGTIKNNRLYVIQYYIPTKYPTKYQNYLPMLQKIVDSFTITK